MDVGANEAFLTAVIEGQQTIFGQVPFCSGRLEDSSDRCSRLFRMRWRRDVVAIEGLETGMCEDAVVSHVRRVCSCSSLGEVCCYKLSSVANSRWRW